MIEAVRKHAMSISVVVSLASAGARAAPGGHLVIVDGSTVTALELPTQDVHWSVDAGFSPSSVFVIPDGNRSVVLVPDQA